MTGEDQDWRRWFADKLDAMRDSTTQKLDGIRTSTADISVKVAEQASRLESMGKSYEDIRNVLLDGVGGEPSLQARVYELDRRIGACTTKVDDVSNRVDHINNYLDKYDAQVADMKLDAKMTIKAVEGLVEKYDPKLAREIDDEMHPPTDSELARVELARTEERAKVGMTKWKAIGAIVGASGVGSLLIEALKHLLGGAQ